MTPARPSTGQQAPVIILGEGRDQQRHHRIHHRGVAGARRADAPEQREIDAEGDERTDDRQISEATEISRAEVDGEGLATGQRQHGDEAGAISHAPGGRGEDRQAPPLRRDRHHVGDAKRQRAAEREHQPDHRRAVETQAAQFRIKHRGDAEHAERAADDGPALNPRAKHQRAQAAHCRPRPAKTRSTTAPTSTCWAA